METYIEQKEDLVGRRVEMKGVYADEIIEVLEIIDADKGVVTECIAMVEEKAWDGCPTKIVKKRLRRERELRSIPGSWRFSWTGRYLKSFGVLEVL